MTTAYGRLLVEAYKAAEAAGMESYWKYFFVDIYIANDMEELKAAWQAAMRIVGGRDYPQKKILKKLKDERKARFETAEI